MKSPISISRLTKLIYYILAVPFFLIGIIVLCIGGANLVRGIKSENWPKTDGVITEARIVKHSSGASSRDSYSAKISYDYIVAGVAYTNTRVCFGGKGSSTEIVSAQEIMNRYPIGTSVSVFYSPQDPASAVLEPGGGESWILFCLGTAFLLSGTWLLTKKNR